MIRAKVLIYICLYTAVTYVDSARILGVFSMPSISHQVVFRALTFELAKRGHELVVFTPNPVSPAEGIPNNITEIDTGAVYLEWRLIKSTLETDEKQNEFLKTRFGPNAPTVRELRNNVQMLFLNAHPIMGNNRPVPPSVVYLGGLHLKPPKPLPQDLQTYLDASIRGVIYVSFGTNVRPSNMDQDFLDAFLQAFESLPYDVLWKFDGDNLERIPKNLKIQKWFPQRDLLLHHNVKAFVTQGGLQSSDEAIDAGVPLIGIPMLADQWYNVNKYVELGIGVQINALTMTADDLTQAVEKIVSDTSYRQNIRRVRAIINDQPESPLERALWWTEHVLKHGGNHLRAPSANTTWSEHLMLDVVLLVLSIILVTGFLLIYASFKIWNLLKYKLEKVKLH
ncbi:UDP-glucuronosyltransferase 2B15-like isoform X2 [Trichoplusia ni]|uniref:UDP-glucuronosyltransferase n=1 Tax=Trichoplusia ni TaxID=7111 RepID=A0A7E5WNC4_TRINI|nr:UDP-glucuronosyltransferase 2B15-like isoform X2 [Trichoplusia ni]